MLTMNSSGAGFRGDVSQFINDHTIHLGQLANNFASVSFRLFPYQGIDEIDSPACLLTLIDERRAQSNGDVGFAGSGAADKLDCGHPL